MSDRNKPRSDSAVSLRFTNSLDDLVQACQLVHTQYSKHGLIPATWHKLHLSLINLLPSSITIVGKKDQLVVATLTSIFAKAPLLPSGSMFNELIANNSLDIEVEGTKFAVDRTYGDTHPSLASDVIKNCVQLWASHNVSAAYVVVHPRHVAFWKRHFGFNPISDAKPCGRVQGAPGVLMKKEFLIHDSSQQSDSTSYPLSEQEAGMLFVLNRSIYKDAQHDYQRAFLERYPQLSRFIQAKENSRSAIMLSAQTFKDFSENVKTILSKASLRIDFSQQDSENIIMIADSLHIFASMTKILEILFSTEKSISSTAVHFSLDHSCLQKYFLNCNICIDHPLEGDLQPLHDCIRSINKTWNSFSDKHHCTLVTTEDSTTIHMQFPIPKAAAAPHINWDKAISQTQSKATDNSRSVLLATSCPSEGMFLATLCRRLGFHPLISREGDSALEIANSVPLHFAIVSFHLPKIQTAEFLTLLKTQQHFTRRKDIPIFGLSSSQEQRAQMLASYQSKLSEVFSVPYSAKDVILTLIHFQLLEFETQERQPLPYLQTHWSSRSGNSMVSETITV